MMQDDEQSESLFKLIYNFRRHIDQFSAARLPALTPIGFNTAYLPYFMSIGHNGISNHGLLKDIKVTRQGVSKAIKELEKSGLVYTAKKEKDARLIMVFLTPEGLLLYNAIQELSNSITTEYIKILGTKRYEALVSSLTELITFHQSLLPIKKLSS
jgi:DNA-binding MarR family transcriptional regulator